MLDEENLPRSAQGWYVGKSTDSRVGVGIAERRMIGDREYLRCFDPSRNGAGTTMNQL